MRAMPSKRPATAVSVPNVSHTPMSCFAANAGTPPTWSECSWVTNIAVIDAGSMPMRASRSVHSRALNPQSIMIRVSPDSTTRQLPSLPEPMDAKRISRRRTRLFELVLEQPEDLVADFGAILRAVGVLHGDEAARRCFGDQHTVLLGLVLVVLLPEHQLRQEAAASVLLRPVDFGMRLTDVVQALRAIAVDDGEPGTVEREPDTAPCAIERVVDDELRAAILRLINMCMVGLRRRLRDRRDRLRLARTEAFHQPREHFSLDLRTARGRSPLKSRRRRIVDLGRRHLFHAAVRNIDFHGAGFAAALESRTELGAGIRGAEDVQVLAHVFVEKIIGDGRTIFRPVGFHDAHRRLLGGDHESLFRPELMHLRPRLLGCRLDHQPALVARARDVRIGILGQQLDAVRTRGILLRERAGGVDRVTVVEARRRQVGRDLERRRVGHRFALDFLAAGGFASRKRNAQRGQCDERGAARECRHCGHWVFLRQATAPASRSAARTTSWNCGDSGSIGSRSALRILPISASAHLTAVGLASTKSLVCSGISRSLLARAVATSPASAAAQTAATARGIRLAATEITPWPPSSMYGSAVSSLPE